MIKITKIHTRPPRMRFRKKVAVYCRVSTQQDIQYNSLEAQRTYYEKLITSRSEWTLVDIYTDQASGRNNKKMNGFQRMMADCRANKIDLILVKSISRMGRNTVEFLKACSELNRLGVEVFFEVEKVYASDPRAVRMLTIFAAYIKTKAKPRVLRLLGDTGLDLPMGHLR